MKELIPYLLVKNALECINFYRDVFDAEVSGELIMLDSITGKEEHKNKLGHGTLKIGPNTVFVSDIIRDDFKFGDQVHFVLEIETKEKLIEVFNKIKESGTVINELKEMAWCEVMGFVTDKFGITWSLFYGHR